MDSERKHSGSGGQSQPSRKESVTEGALDAALAALERRALAADHSSVAMAVSDLSGGLIYVNQAFVQLWALDSADDALGRPAPEFWETSQTAGEILEMLISGRQTRWQGKLVARRRDGRTIPFYVTTSRIEPDGDTPACLVATFQELAGLQQAELELAEFAARYGTLTESTHDWIWEVNQHGVYTYASPAVRHILGFEPEELLGLTPFDLMPPQESEHLAAVFKEAVATGTPIVRLENVNRHRDGSLIVLETNGIPVRDATGALVGYRGVDRDITDRKRAEEALAEREKQYRMLFNEAVDGILVDNPEGILIEVNDAACAITGYPREELVGADIRMLFPPDELAREPLRFDLLARGESVNRQRTMVRRDGVRIIAELHSRKTPDGSNHTIFSDITERRRAGERLRSIFRAAPTGIGLVQIRTIREVNDRLCEMVGYSPEELIGQDARILYPTQEDYEYVGREKYRQIRLTGAGTVETRWRRKDGAIIDVLLSSAPLIPDDLAAGATFTALDITERKRAEDALRESEERYRSVYESAPIAFVLWDTACRITDWNRHAEELFGWSRTEVLGQNFFGFLIPAASRPHVEEIVERILRGELPSHSVNQNLTRDGRIILCDWHNAVRRDSRGLVVGVTSLGMDITERRRLDEKIQQTQRLESLGVLAGGVAHDFNNLLMAILGHADLACQAMSPLAPGQENLREIVVASRRAADLCRQMLAYSGRGRFVVEAIDLRELVEEMVHLLRTSISKKASLNLQLSAGLPLIEADASQVRQVVMNLVLNASEALGESGGVIALVTGVQDCNGEFLRSTYLAEELPEGRYVYLEVSDSGCGMDAETRRRLFEPFFTTKFAGRGLGLAAVLGIVRGHRGALTLESEPGRGATFKIFFPSLAPAPAASPRPHRPAAAWSGSGATVLLVDDEEPIRSLGVLMLQALGLEVLAAADGAEALEIYRSRPGRIDCVLVDLTMPRMDGEETFRAIRAEDPSARILLSSGYTEQEVATRFPGPRPDAFIQKPYTLDALRNTLREVLTRPQ